MEFVLLGLIVLAFPVIAIVALVKAVGLGDRMRRLEDRFATLEGRLAGAAAGPAPFPQSTEQPTPTEQAAPVAEPAAAPKVATAPTPDTVSPAAPLPAAATPETLASFEERFGTRWTVWIGGVALALGGVFLVKYSIEAGLIGPGMRIFLGALFAAALIVGGEWTRRREQLSGFAGLPTAHIPSILTAAGTTVAYAVAYAAYGLYGFLSPGAAFVLLGVVALATLAAALLHGPMLAGLGLVGAYVTPLLIATDTPNYWALYVYLAVVTAAAFTLARMRMWSWLALTAIVFSLFWTFPGVLHDRVDALTPHLFHAVAGFALAAALIVAGCLYGPDAEPGKLDPLSSIALAAYLAAALLLALASRHDASALLVFTLLTIAALAIAWRTDAAAAAVPVAAVFAAWLIIRWALEIEFGDLIAGPGTAGPAAPQPWRAEAGPHLVLGAAFAALFGAAGYAAQGRSASALIPTLWSAAGVLAPIAILIALYYRVAGFERSIPFAAIALLLATLFALATEQLGKREPRPGLAASTALFATGSIAALALALTFAMEKGWLTVGLALMVPGIAWVAENRPLPLLRPLAAALTVLVVLRIGWEPRIVGGDLGTAPIFNWLLWGYGVPALAFWGGGHLMRRRADDVPGRIVDSAAILFTVLAVFLQIRHYMTGGDIYRSTSPLAELALHVCAGLAIAIGLEHVRGRTRSVVHDVGALVVAAATFIAIVFGLLVAENPLLTGAPVGGPVVNLILLGYGLPAILAIALALHTRGRRSNIYRAGAATAAVLLLLLYLSLQVSRFYQGPILTADAQSDIEKYTYSVVWLAYGVVLLLFGIWMRSQPARLASAAITALTVAKVFLIDMADLTGVYRALSFIGLGLVLVGIGYLYQRLLFPRQPPPATAITNVPSIS
jgi:uncharacterized membrane protein